MMSLLDYSKLNGVKDLPIKVRGKFAQALRLEDQGEHSKAEDKINEAIAAEQDNSGEVTG